MAPDDEADWQAAFDAWLEPFLAALGHKARRGWAPLYLRGLLGPGARKSVEPLAQRVAPGAVQQRHHFVAASPWPVEPLEAVLAAKADELVGGPGAALVIDDTALPKQGQHSMGVARQSCGQLGKRANCQALVSLTLARAEVPVPVGLRLYLPEGWCGDAARRRGGGPGSPRTSATGRNGASPWTSWIGCVPPACASAAPSPTPATAPAPPSGGGWPSGA